jgi:hypothetical protein
MCLRSALSLLSSPLVLAYPVLTAAPCLFVVQLGANLRWVASKPDADPTPRYYPTAQGPENVYVPFEAVTELIPVPWNVATKSHTLPASIL